MRPRPWAVMSPRPRLRPWLVSLKSNPEQGKSIMYLMILAYEAFQAFKCFNDVSLESTMVFANQHPFLLASANRSTSSYQNRPLAHRIRSLTPSSKLTGRSENLRPFRKLIIINNPDY